MQISIATVNLWGLPWPFSIHKSRRIRDLIPVIQKERFDVLAIQELWIPRDLRIIKNSLPEYHVFAKSNTAINPSGLVLFSLFDLHDCRVIPFHMPLFHKENPSHKGVLKAHIRINENDLTICNTHLYFGGKQKLHPLQKKQFTQLNACLPKTPTILCGDFNVNKNQLDIQKTFTLLSNPEVFTIDYSTRYARFLFNRVHGRDRSPDMIFANFPTDVTKTRIITEPLLSDHFLVVVKMKI